MSGQGEVHSGEHFVDVGSVLDSWCSGWEWTSGNLLETTTRVDWQDVLTTPGKGK